MEKDRNPVVGKQDGGYKNAMRGLSYGLDRDVQELRCSENVD